MYLCLLAIIFVIKEKKAKTDIPLSDFHFFSSI